MQIIRLGPFANLDAMDWTFTGVFREEHCTALRKVLVDWASTDDDTWRMEQVRRTVLEYVKRDVDICFVSV
jgi:hypothetical protein